MRLVLFIIIFFLSVFALLGAEQIIIKGKQIAEGKYLPAKVINIKNNDNYVKGQFYVKLKDVKYASLLSNESNSLIKKNDIKITFPFKNHSKDDNTQNADVGLERIALVTLRDDADIISLCKHYNELEEVEYAVPRFIQYFRYTPDDPELDKQYYLDVIKAYKAWDISTGSSEVIIGIVDSGTDVFHADLKENIYTNPNEIEGNGKDDDVNGYIDDVRGWDFVGDISQADFQNGIWKEDNDVTSNNLGNWHGTHVAGIAGASADNSVGMAGVGFNCKILPVKVAPDNTNPATGGINASLRGYEGILYAAEMGADVISVSWGAYNYSPFEEDILKQAQAHGALIVAAVGNDNLGLNAESDDFPAMYPGVLAVGATNSNSGLSNYTNWGYPVDVFTTGNSIYSTMPLDEYKSQTGASMAAPIVAGTAALVKSVFPEYSSEQIYQQIKSTAIIRSNTGRDNYEYFKSLDAENALKHNNTQFPEMNTPGIGISGLSSDYENGFIGDYDTHIITFELKNYLADAENVTVEISTDFNMQSETQQKVYQNINSGEEVEFEYSYKLDTDFPWYSYKIGFTVKIYSDEYQNIEYSTMPIMLSTFNQFLVVQEFEGFNIKWEDSHASNFEDFWAVGQNQDENAGVIFSYVNNTPEFNSISPFEPLCIYVVDDNTAYLGTRHNDFLETTDRGKSFNVFSIGEGGERAIIDLEYDGNNFYALNELEGNYYLHKGNKNNWVQLSNLGSNPHKMLLSNNILLLLRNISDQTIQMKISYDFGENWIDSPIQVGNVGIELLSAEMINDSIVGVSYKYSVSGIGHGKLIEYDIKNHEITNSFGDKSYKFAYLYSPYDSDDLFGMYNDVASKKITNNNITQNLSYSHHQAQTFSGAVECGRVRMWNMGKDAAFLEFDYEPYNSEKLMQVLSGDTMDFDSLEMYQDKSDFVMLENEGNSRVMINDLQIEGSDAFYISEERPYWVDACGLESFYMHFNPQTAGEHNATLVISSDAMTDELKISLSGFATATGIDYSDNNSSLTIYPVPANDILYFETDDIIINHVEIYNIAGISQISRDIHTGNFSVDIADFLPGLYYIKYTTNTGESDYLKFPVVK